MDVGRDVLKLFVPVHTLLDEGFVYVESAKAFVINCVVKLGVSVLVGSDVLNVFVPVHALFAESIAADVVYVASAYVFVISWVPVLGVSVLVGRKEL